MYQYHIPVPNRQKKILKKDSGGHGEVANLIFLKEESLGLKELKSDIRNGAAFLNKIPAYVKDEIGQNIIFIHAEDEESGLIALNWLELCLREKERNSVGNGTGDEQDEDDDSDIIWDYEEEPWEFIATDPRIVPIIEYRDLLAQYREGGRDSGFAGSTAMYFARSQESQDPYWLHCTENCICIRMDYYDMPNLTEEYLDVFGNNKRIYVLKLDLWMNEGSGFGRNQGDFEIPFGGSEAMGSDNSLKRSLVMCMAGYVRSKASKEERLRYYSILFKQSVSEFGLRLNRDFNSEKLTGYLIELADGTMGIFCSDYIHKAVLYASRQKKGSKTLTEEDFCYLYKDVNDSAKAVGWKRLDEELIGLDGVKEHVHSIVNNLLYERLRREKGLPTLGYHNVFMMLGAPGTAKTTVAEILGDILREEHLLKGNRFISVNGAELKGKFVGWTTEKVKQIFAAYDIIFIDANPSFSMYTQIAIATATKVILPVMADDSSKRAIQNAFSLIYGLKLPSEIYSKYAFAEKLKEVNQSLPKVYMILRNRITQYMGPASAYATVLNSINEDVESLLITNPEIFFFKNIQEGVVDVRDFQTTGVVSAARGCPFSVLPAGRLEILGRRVQVKSEYLQNYVNNIREIVKRINDDI